jgi:hypothetical protein
MRSFMLQDWTTIRGGTGVNTVTQQETDWLDLSAFRDVAFWIDVKETSGTPILGLQTAPARDDSLFLAMVTNVTLAVATAPTVVQAFAMQANVPIAWWLRWQLSGTPPWDATFRIFVAANMPCR